MHEAEVIAFLLLFVAYTHAYHCPETWPVCALAAILVITLYCGWCCVRVEVIRWLIGKVEAAQEAYGRAEIRMEDMYDTVAKGALAFGKDFERLHLAIQSVPVWIKWGSLCLTIAVEWALFMMRAWMLEEGDTILNLVACASGGILVLLSCLKLIADAHEKEEERKRVNSQALIVRGSTTPSERSSIAQDRREREKKQAERSAAYGRQDEEYDQDNSKTDAFGNLSLSVITKRSTRSADPGVHQPKLLVFPEDLPTTPPPKAQPTIQYVQPTPEPEPDWKPIDWHAHEHAQYDLQIAFGRKPMTLSCAGNCPLEKKPAEPKGGTTGSPGHFAPDGNAWSDLKTGGNKPSEESTSGLKKGKSEGTESSSTKGGASQPDDGPSEGHLNSPKLIDQNTQLQSLKKF